jgi:hypothetical protein
MTKVLKAGLIQRTDTKDKWTSFNPILANNERVFEIQPDGSRKEKIGDGVTRYNSLPFHPGSLPGGPVNPELIGDLALLKTADKNNLVAAINYVMDNAGIKPEDIDESLQFVNEKLGVNFEKVPTKAEYNALRDALIPHPTYGMPSAALSANKGITGEIGQTISDVTFSQVFTQRDGGQVYGYQFRKNGNMFDVGTSITETIILTGAAVNYQGAVYYYEGPVKNNVLGMPDPTGKILAGTALTNILQAIGYNATWYGASNAAPSDSAGVRALQTYNASNQLVSGKQLTNAGNSFTHRTGIINTVHSIVTAPGKSLLSVIDQDALNKDITDEYVYVGTLSVNTAAGVPTAGYKLYVKTMGVAYTSSHRHLITLN